MTIEDEFVDVIDIPKSRPYNQKLKERCVKITKKTKIKDPLKVIMGLITDTGPLRCVDIYRRLDMNESTCFYRLEKLCNEGVLVKRGDLLYTLPKDQDLVQEEKTDQKKSPGPIIMCKNQSICKYFDSNTCYPEICKYFIENKK